MEAKTINKNIAKIAFIALVCLLGIAVTHAQNFIAAKSFVKDKKVYLRFVPNNSNAFNDCLEKGFIVKRISWEQSTLPDSANFKLSSSQIIKPYGKDDKAWSDLIQKTQEAGFLYTALFKPIPNTVSDPDMAYGLAMLSCDFDTELAKAAGLFYTDERLAAGKYAYMIQPADTRLNKKIPPAVVLVNTAIDDKLKDIDSLKVQVTKKEVKLVWPVKHLKSDYTGYFIESSEDGKNFVSINKKQHIKIKTQY